MMSESLDPAAGIERPRAARRKWLRFVLLIGILMAGLAVVRFTPVGEYVDIDRAVATMDAMGRNPLAPAILIGIWAVASPIGIPVSPLVIASGIVFGNFWGWIYSLTGAMVAASASFWLGRLLGHDLVAHYLGEERLSRVESLVSRHGFLTVFRTRFAPLPFALINTGAALAGMRFSNFLVASLLGLAPSLWVYNYFAHALFNAAAADRPGVWRNLFFALGAFLAITLVPALWVRLRARREP